MRVALVRLSWFSPSLCDENHVMFIIWTMNGILVHNTQNGRCGYAHPKLVLKSLHSGPTRLNKGFIYQFGDHLIIDRNLILCNDFNTSSSSPWWVSQNFTPLSTSIHATINRISNMLFVSQLTSRPWCVPCNTPSLHHIFQREPIPHEGG